MLGEIAHIHGKKPRSPRYRVDMTDDERDHYNNLIYLCPNCHTKIDKHEEDYPAKHLFKIKQVHEEWVMTQLDQSVSEVAFHELETAANALLSGKHSSENDFQVISPENKIKRNKLTNTSRIYISMGLSRSDEVARFIANMTTHVDAKFSERLKNGFVNKYLELNKTHSGDELFMSMLDFAHAGKKDFDRQAAGLTILCHLFHLCEVFEK